MTSESIEVILPLILSGSALLLFIITMIMQIQLNKRYKAFTALSNEVNVEEVLKSNQKMIKLLYAGEEDICNRLAVVDQRLDGSFSKIAVTKYDAFDGMGGQMSAIIALLNDQGDGVLLHSIHTREGNHLYTKAIEKGQAIQTLSKEEELTLKEAINSK